mgnify:CR=1 FL=1
MTHESRTNTHIAAFHLMIQIPEKFSVSSSVYLVSCTYLIRVVQNFNYSSCHHHHQLRLPSLVSHSWGGRDMSCLHCFLSSAISSVMFSFFMSSSTTLLQVFFGLPTGLLPSTSSSIALLSMLFSSLRFTRPNHLNLVFLNLCSRFSTPHLLLTSSLVILCCHLTPDMYLSILW